jgi:hypothetical protein
MITQKQITSLLILASTLVGVAFATYNVWLAFKQPNTVYRKVEP